jgi:hypothetical protein
MGQRKVYPNRKHSWWTDVRSRCNFENGTALVWKSALWIISKLHSSLRAKEFDLIPILFQQQLFDPVGVQHLVIQQMPKHDKYRIMIERLMYGSFLPLGGR